MTKMCRKSFLNGIFGCCVFFLIFALTAFIYTSFHFGLFDYLSTPPLDPHGATQLSQRSFDSSFEGTCTLQGCNVTGVLEEGNYEFYYLVVGTGGIQHTFTGFGSDLQNFHVVTKEGTLPVWPQDDHLVNVSNTEVQIWKYPGSCKRTILFFGITPKQGHSKVPYSLLIKDVQQQGNNCFSLWIGYLNSILVGLVGLVLWLVLVIVWVVWGCTKQSLKATAEEEEKFF